MDEGRFFTVTNEAGERLACWLHEADKEKHITLVLHGFPGDAKGGSLERAETLKQNGVNACRFEYRGCGDSEGESTECTIETAFDDARLVLAILKDRGYENISLVGSSFGGAVALKLALEEDVETMVLCAPAPDLTHPDEWAQHTTLEEWKDKGFFEIPDMDDPENSFKVSFQYYLDAKENILFEPARDIKVRTLILHGDQDDVVPLKDSQKLAENMPHALLIVLEGADHKLEVDGSRSESMRIMREWFQQE